MISRYQKTVYVVDGLRTPFLKMRGKPGPFSASDLAFWAGRSLLEKQSFKPSDLDEVLLGCVMPSPEEANIARVVALRLGCGHSVPAWTVQRNCASGMQALDSAAQNIVSGRSHLVLAGGTEAMSHAPVLFSRDMVNWLGTWQMKRSWKSRFQNLGRLRPRHLKPVIALLKGLTDPIVGLSMGQTAEILAHRFGITREEMDAYAMESHLLLDNAVKSGCMKEVEVIYDQNGNYYHGDDGLRPDSDMKKLGKLKAVFDRGVGKVTAGNSAQVTDGAAMLILASEEAVKKYGLSVLGKIVGCHWAGLDPSQMGLGPAHAVPPLLKENQLKPDQIDFWEINEAFAAQVLACLKAWKDPDYCKNELQLDKTFGEIEPSRMNIDGGGISMGHPVGASGARIVLHLLHVLKRKGAKRGVATLCIGGGQGGAMLVEIE